MGNSVLSFSKKERMYSGKKIIEPDDIPTNEQIVKLIITLKRESSVTRDQRTDLTNLRGLINFLDSIGLIENEERKYIEEYYDMLTKRKKERKSI